MAFWLSLDLKVIGRAIRRDFSCPMDLCRQACGLDVLASAKGTVHTVGCTRVTAAALNACKEYRLCHKCARRPPDAQQLLWANLADAYPLLHAERDCFYVGNSGVEMKQACSVCWGNLKPFQRQRLEAVQTYEEKRTNAC